MRIFGIGIDVVEIGRIAASIERHGEPFLAKIFTAAEREYCEREEASRATLRGAVCGQRGGFQGLWAPALAETPDCRIWKSCTIRRARRKSASAARRKRLPGSTALPMFRSA